MGRDEPRRVRRIALTGGIATGKTYVRSRIDALGVPTLDADTLARQAVAPGSEGLDQVARRFGPEILDETGGLNRAKLAALIFADAEARRALEAIIHPYVRNETDRWFTSLDPAVHSFAIADIPLLFERGRETDFEEVVVVACDARTQLRRLVERDGLSRDEAHLRLGAQLPIDDKVRRADYVIRTDATFAETNLQIDAVLARLRSRQGG